MHFCLGSSGSRPDNSQSDSSGGTSVIDLSSPSHTKNAHASSGVGESNGGIHSTWCGSSIDSNGDTNHKMLGSNVWKGKAKLFQSADYHQFETPQSMFSCGQFSLRPLGHCSSDLAESSRLPLGGDSRPQGLVLSLGVAPPNSEMDSCEGSQTINSDVGPPIRSTKQPILVSSTQQSDSSASQGSGVCPLLVCGRHFASRGSPTTM